MAIRNRESVIYRCEVRTEVTVLLLIRQGARSGRIDRLLRSKILYAGLSRFFFATEGGYAHTPCCMI